MSLKGIGQRIQRVRKSTAWAVFLGVFWAQVAYTGVILLWPV